MSGAQALRAAREAGIQVEMEGDSLKLKAASRPQQAVVDDLKCHKAEIIILLRRQSGTWSAEDWQGHFEERAAIAEYDGGLSQEEAEAQAFAACVAEWLDRNPVRSSRDWCLVCGRPDGMGEPLLPVGVEPSGSAWLHPDCWAEWYAGRREQAVAALASIGITAKRTLS